MLQIGTTTMASRSARFPRFAGYGPIEDMQETRAVLEVTWLV